MVALASPLGCATTGLEELDNALDTCGEVCGTAVACVVLAPCAVAGAAGFVMGACTRCSEGPDPVDTSAEEEASAREELPPSPRVAAAEMRY
jgi:hypothetical protein